MIDLDALAAAARPATGGLARLALDEKATDRRGGAPRKRFEKNGVRHSAELERVASLPRRDPPSLEEQTEMAAVMTAMLTRGPVGCECAKLRPGWTDPCITKFFPVQGWYLWEAMQTRGAIGMLAAGAGKTALDIFLAMVVPGVKRAALLIPPNLREQFADDFLLWSQHFRVPNLGGGKGVYTPGAPKLDVLAYSELSNKSCAEWLAIHKPQLIIADECQALSDKDSVRTGRFIDHYVTEEQTLLCAHSGSLTTHGLDDYGHIAALALREGSPLPLPSEVVGEWAAALDPKPILGMGALRILCGPRETARQGFQRRLVQTPGVITTEDAQVACKLEIRYRPVSVPPIVEKALGLIRAGYRPDDLEDKERCEDVLEKTEQIAHAKQIALGFFYRWCYPRGESVELIDEWFRKRKAWNRELRQQLERRERLMDSPALCREAAERFASGYVGDLPLWDSRMLPAWAAIENEVQPQPEVVWLDETAALDAVAWGKEQPGIIWYSHVAFGERVAALGGFPLYEGGKEFDAAIRTELGDRTIVASVQAHGLGKNLQHAFWRNLVTASPLIPWEQLTARTHRYKQPKDTVVVDVYLQTLEVFEAFEGAMERATYVSETTGKAERLLYASIHMPANLEATCK